MLAFQLAVYCQYGDKYEPSELHLIPVWFTCVMMRLLVTFLYSDEVKDDLDHDDVIDDIQ